jgi:hypothetical protein
LVELAIEPARGAFVRRTGGKFRFRAGFMAWQYRNAGLISSTYPHAKAENHAIVTF